VSVHKLDEPTNSSTHILMMKGAPERILEHCSSIFVNGQNVPLTTEWQQSFNDAYNEIGGLGERVLGFCDLYFKASDDTVFDVDSGNVPLNDLRFLGLISLIDPPRANVPEAVAKCRSAGVRVVMVTGDHPTTAKAIARIIGIISEQSETPEDMAQRLNVSIEQIRQQLVFF